MELGELSLDVFGALPAVDVHLVHGCLHLHLGLGGGGCFFVCHGADLLLIHPLDLASMQLSIWRIAMEDEVREACNARECSR